MTRNGLIVEIQSRLSSIKIANGFSFDLSQVLRNPIEPPMVESMPMACLFEAPDTVDRWILLGATKAPKAKRSLSIIIEYWRSSLSEGRVSWDILEFLDYSRYVLFNDGVTLGGEALSLAENETTRIIRPEIGGNTSGIGVVYTATYVEDYSLLTV